MPHGVIGGEDEPTKSAVRNAHHSEHSAKSVTARRSSNKKGRWQSLRRDPLEARQVRKLAAYVSRQAASKRTRD